MLRPCGYAIFDAGIIRSSQYALELVIGALVTRSISVPRIDPRIEPYSPNPTNKANKDLFAKPLDE